MEINKQVKRVTDDNVLIKYKSAGLSDEVIASKMNVSVEEVRIRWNQLVEIAAHSKNNGYGELAAQFNTMALQYQLLGESMKICAAALSDVMPISEVAEFIVDDRAQTLKNLSENCIILKPFTAVDPAAALEQANQAVQQNN